jgi:hypothetical protein
MANLLAELSQKELSHDSIAHLLSIDLNILKKQLCDRNNTCVIKTKVKQILRGDDGILCFVVQMYAHSVKPNGTVSKWGQDDLTYDKYKLLFTILPRARSCCLMIKDGIINQFNLQGLPKFLGQTTDEEDEHVDGMNNGLFELETKDTDDTREIITEKENGKMAVITFFNYLGELYYYGGSKNDHTVIAIKNMNKYSDKIKQTKQKTFAMEITEIFIKNWNALTIDQINAIIIETINNENVLCAEYNDGKHIVHSLQEPNLVFFGMINKHKITNTLCEDIVQTSIKFDLMGLRFVRWEILGSEKQLCLEEENALLAKEINPFTLTRQNARFKSNIEGYVIHKQKKINDESPEWLTVSLEKFKTWWYVIIRMLREFLKSKNISNNNWTQKFYKRNKEYMKMNQQYAEQWHILTLQFLNWFRQKNYDIKDVGCMYETGMATYWFNFLNETGASNPIAIEQNLLVVDEDEKHFDTTELNRFVFFTVGIPGLGKSTIGTALKKQLNYVYTIEQDDYAKYKKNSGKKCYEAFVEMLENKLSVIFVQRNNSNSTHYKQYAESAKQHNYKVIMLTAKEIDTNILSLVCLQSVYNRQGHAIDNLPKNKQMQLVMTFLRDIEQPVVNECVDKVFELNYLNDQEVVLDQSLVDYYCDWHANSKSFKTIPPSESDILTNLQLLAIDYQTKRRSIDDICDDIIQIIENLRLDMHPNAN